MSQENVATPAGQPTQKDAFFFLTILSNMKNAPEVDWDVVAQKAGYSNAVTARTRFGQIKKKLGFTADAPAPPAGAGKAPRAKKAKTNGSGTNTNASKVTKRSPAKGGRKNSDAMEADGEEQEDLKEEGDSGIGSAEDLAVHDADTNHFEEGVEYYDTVEDPEAGEEACFKANPPLLATHIVTATATETRTASG